MAIVYKPLQEQGFLGVYEPQKKLITIDDQLSHDEELHTELHEVLHAAWDRLSLNQTAIPREVQEIIVDGFATVLVENYKIKAK